ncbi:hypothetical protein [Bradyrhizobium ottawaense]
MLKAGGPAIPRRLGFPKVPLQSQAGAPLMNSALAADWIDDVEIELHLRLGVPGLMRDRFSRRCQTSVALM